MRRSLPILIVSILAVALAGFALSGCGSGGAATAASAHRAKAAVAAKTVAVLVKSDEQRGRKGPDGKWHDAFLPAEIAVKAGQRVTLTFANSDDMPHTFTTSQLGVNVKIPGGSEKAPGKATVTFTAPSTPGRYLWICAMPCDPWAMAHDGYMRGHVTVTA